APSDTASGVPSFDHPAVPRDQSDLALTPLELFEVLDGQEARVFAFARKVQVLRVEHTGQLVEQALELHGGPAVHLLPDREVGPIPTPRGQCFGVEVKGVRAEDSYAGGIEARWNAELFEHHRPLTPAQRD